MAQALLQALEAVCVEVDDAGGEGANSEDRVTVTVICGGAARASPHDDLQGSCTEAGIALVRTLLA